MERPYTGLTALVKINSTTIGYINGVDLTLDKDIAEILQFGAQYKEKVPTIKNWSASSEGTVAFAAGEGQHKLYQAFESGELVTLLIQLDNAVYFEGQALVSSLNISGSPDDALSISVEFEGSGGISFTLPETVIAVVTSGVGGTTNPAGTIRATKGSALSITCLPAAGKVADKYFLNGSSSGVAITANAFSLPALAADTTVNVTFKNV